MQLLADVEACVRDKYKNGSQHRLNHIIGVVKMASYLAKRYNVNEEKAMIAAWMHDYSKFDDFSNAKDYLTLEEVEECEKYPFLYHAYLSAEHYKRLGGVDNEIYLAIRNHVFGRPGMSKLEEIVMIADYTEENREYPTCQKCRQILLKGNLYGAIVYSLERTMEHVKEQGEIPHPTQELVYLEYKERQKMTLTEILVSALGKVKATDILAYDTTKRSPYYDTMILASVSSERQATAAISYIREDVEKAGFSVRHVEGAETEWVLIDCNDAVVSIFTEDERKYFALEKIYMDVPVKKYEN